MLMPKLGVKRRKGRNVSGHWPGVLSIICGDKAETGYLYARLPLETQLNAPFTVPQIKSPTSAVVAQKGFVF